MANKRKPILRALSQGHNLTFSIVNDLGQAIVAGKGLDPWLSDHAAALADAAD